MDSIYEKYISKLNLIQQTAYGQCREICEKMNDKFPELKLTRGHYYCTVWGERTHWWLQTSDNKIIDPTAIQFPSKGHYVPWNETQTEPTGQCPNCGEYIYDGKYTHKECEIAFLSSLVTVDIDL